MKRVFIAAMLAASSLCCLGAAGADSTPNDYATFTASAHQHAGLFPIWQKGNDTYLELAPNQLDADFLETIVPGNGIGDSPLWWGDTDYLPTQVLRFERRGDKIVMIWRNWYAYTGSNGAAAAGVAASFPDSVVGVGKIVAENAAGHVIFDLSSLLGDNLDVRNILSSRSIGKSYRLDPATSYFDSVKAFPENDVFTVSQTWSTDESHQYDAAPDARRLQIRVVYNFVQIPQDDYRKRLMDDRIGLYDDIYVDFSTDTRETRLLPYIVRWDFERHPMVYYLSNSIPPEYRGAIRDALLEWNKALQRAGTRYGVEVRDQPNDPNWDPEDYRYSVVRWLDETRPSFGADSQTLFNPMTGEELRTGILVSSVVGMSPRLTWKYLVDPVRYGRVTDPMPPKFLHDAIFSTILHEAGHNMGMQHNFIGHEAYTAEQLQSMAFTREHGITSSAMEYAPLNLWPQPYKQGEYQQVTIGPYDYYAIHWGYASVPGAATPEQEVPALRAWAQGWSNPWTRYASDEDVDYATGHASDPRVEQGMLTNDPIAWCNVQMQMYRTQIAALNRYWPQAGNAFEEERGFFATMLGRYLRCAGAPAHYLGGQYLSWAHAGDPGAQPPIVPVPLPTQRRAMDVLDAALFNPNALDIPPSLLNRLRYSEWSGYGYTSWEGYGNLPEWAYKPPDRHDYPLVETINRAQMSAINYVFLPLVLQRIDENPSESTGATMNVADLFDWLHDGIFNNLRNRTIPLLSRNLQFKYVEALQKLAATPPEGTPPDAVALARASLTRIAREAAAATHTPHDAITSAHLAELARKAKA